MDLTPEDEALFKDLGFTPPGRQLSYTEQIELIRSINSFAIENIPHKDAIPEYQSREPSDIIKAGGGLCYDRARFIEKLAKFHGFKSRHFFVIFLDRAGLSQSSGVIAALTRVGSDSHALSEVKTERGWVVVGTNSKWVAVTKDGDPSNSRELPSRVEQLESLPEWAARPFIAIPGLYSRRGQFYPPFFPGPEINWGELFSD